MCMLELDGLCGTRVMILKDADGRDHAWPHFFCQDPRQLDGNITRWKDIHELLDDPFVLAFLQGAAYALQMTPALVQTLTMEYPTGFVGYEGIADISSGNHEVKIENRRGQLVQVVEEEPIKTKLLTFYFSFREDCWYIGTVYAGPASPSFKDVEWWSRHAFYDMRKMSEEC